jgi:hypothetical protein
MESWLKEIESIATRDDLTQDQKGALVSKKIDDYQQQTVSNAIPEPTAMIPIPNPDEVGDEEFLQAIRKRFRKSVAEGKSWLISLEEHRETNLKGYPCDLIANG